MSPLSMIGNHNTHCLPMSTPGVVELSSDEEDERSGAEHAKRKMHQGGLNGVHQQGNAASIVRRGSTENGRVSTSKDVRNGFDAAGGRGLGANVRGILAAPPGFTKPMCRQFWKAGDYDAGVAARPTLLNGRSHLRVHPKFLHSNATSHTWVFGAIAELLDNAVDEIHNGATHVCVDKAINPRNGGPALLIQDDGGGMCPETIRKCMSFGFSDKSTKSSIGQYGNGFKTSTMRLGADAIVFTRRTNNGLLTQSVGLLSYTFLTLTGSDDVVVPMVDYVFDPLTGKCQSLPRINEDQFSYNLSILMQWSPYASEAELLKQFDSLGQHGTRVVIYNLWLNDDGDLELDFDTDAEDILVNGAPKIVGSKKAMLTHEHYAVRFRHSLRLYSSILYLRIRKSFKIILRGQIVDYRYIVDDIKFHEYILYKPQGGGDKEACTVTTIGFIKEAPHMNIHGFNVYHKSRLILPFWQVLHHSKGKGKGVVGVLEANFMEPTHDKQGFERTTLFNKLETRLKQMTVEYWDLHCGLIGYKQETKASLPPLPACLTAKPGHLATTDGISTHPTGGHYSFTDGRETAALNAPNPGNSFTYANASRKVLEIHNVNSKSGYHEKRKQHHSGAVLDSAKRQALPVQDANDPGIEHATQVANDLENQEALAPLLRENEKLHAQCAEYENKAKELEMQVQRLKFEIQVVNSKFERLWQEAVSIGVVDAEKQS